MRIAQLLIGVFAAASTACGGADKSSSRPQTTHGDTVHVRIDTLVTASQVRQATVVQTIAPMAGTALLFADPVRLRLGNGGEFLISDGPKPTLALFGADGKLRRRLGQHGEGPGEYESVHGGIAAATNGGWAVFDNRKTRITTFDSSGTLRSTWEYPARPSGNMDMLVSDRAGGLRLLQPVPDSGAPDVPPRPAYVSTTAELPMGEPLFLATLGVTPTDYVLTFKSADETGTTTLFNPMSAREHHAWHPDGFVVTLETGGYRLLLNRLNKPVVVHRTLPQLLVSAEERGLQEANVLRAMREQDPAWKLPDGLVSATRPPASGLFITRDGRIWVSVNLPTQRYTLVDTTSAGVVLPPRVAFRRPVEYEVFSADGNFLARVALPSRTYIEDADGGVIWGFQYGADEEVSIVKLRIDFR